MRAPIRKMGNWYGVIVPKAVLMQIGVEAGHDMDLSVDEGRLVLVPVKRHPRAGWAEASKRIAQANDDDADLKW